MRKALPALLHCVFLFVSSLLVQRNRPRCCSLRALKSGLSDYLQLRVELGHKMQVRGWVGCMRVPATLAWRVCLSDPADFHILSVWRAMFHMLCCFMMETSHHCHGTIHCKA